MPKISIKPITKSDIPVLKQHLGFGDGIRYDDETYLRRYERQQSGSGVFLVAWAKDIPVGHLAIGWQGHYFTPEIMAKLSGEPIPGLFSLMVHPDFRQNGIATTLINTAEEMIIAKGFSKIGIAVATNNNIASSIYYKLGYKATGIEYFESTPLEYIDYLGNKVIKREKARYLLKQL